MPESSHFIVIFSRCLSLKVFLFSDIFPASRLAASPRKFILPWVYPSNLPIEEHYVVTYLYSLNSDACYSPITIRKAGAAEDPKEEKCQCKKRPQYSESSIPGIISNAGVETILGTFLDQVPRLFQKKVSTHCFISKMERRIKESEKYKLGSCNYHP